MLNAYPEPDNFFAACEKELAHATMDYWEPNHKQVAAALRALTAISLLQKTYKLHNSTIASYITKIATERSTSDNIIGAVRHITKVINLARQLGINDFSYCIAGTLQKYDNSEHITSGEGLSITIVPGTPPKVAYSGPESLADQVHAAATPNVPELSLDTYAAKIVGALKSADRTHTRLDIEPPRPYLTIDGQPDFYSWKYGPNTFNGDDDYEYSQELQHISKLVGALDAEQENKLVLRLALDQEEYNYWPTNTLQYTDREDFYRVYNEIIKE